MSTVQYAIFLIASNRLLIFHLPFFHHLKSWKKKPTWMFSRVSHINRRLSIHRRTYGKVHSSKALDEKGKIVYWRNVYHIWRPNQRLNSCLLFSGSEFQYITLTFIICHRWMENYFTFQSANFDMYRPFFHKTLWGLSEWTNAYIHRHAMLSQHKHKGNGFGFVHRSTEAVPSNYLVLSFFIRLLLSISTLLLLLLTSAVEQLSMERKGWSKKS